MWWLDGWGISGEVGRINKWGINGRRDKCAVNGPLPAIPTPSRGETGAEDRLVELHCTDDEDACNVHTMYVESTLRAYEIYGRERKFMEKDLHWSYLFHTNFNISVKNLRQETEIDNFIIGLWYS